MPASLSSDPQGVVAASLWVEGFSLTGCFLSWVVTSAWIALSRGQHLRCPPLMGTVAVPITASAEMKHVQGHAVREEPPASHSGAPGINSSLRGWLRDQWAMRLLI